MIEGREPRQRRGAGCGCFVIVGLVLVLVSGSVFAVDRVCYHYLTQRLPIYEGAVVRSRTYNAFSEFGMGNTAVTLYTPDESGEVRAWYALHTGELLREWARTQPPLYTIAQGRIDVIRDDSGAGSQIILFGTCANS